jgi:ankyrin repeat protein
LIRTLLERGNDLNLRSRIKFTAFDIAVDEHRWEAARMLSSSGKVSSGVPGYDTWLRTAVSRRDADSVRQLLQLGAATDVIGSDGYLPIQAAAAEGDVESIRLLAAAGAQLDADTDRVTAALHIAYERKQDAAARVLIDLGASVDVPAREWTKLQRAAHDGRVEFVKLALELGANVNVSSPQAPAPLLLASERGHVDVVRLLLDGGADVSARQGTWTAVGLAQSRGHEAVRTLLLEHGAR